MLPDTEREAQIRAHVKHVALMCGQEAEIVQGHVTFLLRLLDEARAEIEDWRGRLATQCGKTLAAQAVQRERRQWRPIDEKTPQHGNYVRVSCEEGVLYAPHPDAVATHWMPLPAAPQPE